MTTVCVEEAKSTAHYPQQSTRRCAICGTVLTWNPNVICCCCEDRIDRDSESDNRWKIAPANYPLILALREEGWTHKRLAEFYGVTPGYMCELVGRIKRGKV